MSLVLSVGQDFAGDFTLERELSEGGMGVVYIALQRSTGKRRALKVMQPTLISAKDPAQREKNTQRFLAEARAGGDIKSEHVVEVLGAGIDAATGAPWLVMELLEGNDLDKEITQRERLPIAEVHDLFVQLCHALGAAYRVGVCHLDLKPENIFLARSQNARGGQTVKVLDFGIARLVSEHKRSTTVTTAIGSPFWMSPEQSMRGSKVGAYTDVWSLGLIAFRVLAGRHYWREANVPREEVNVTGWLMEMMTQPIDLASARAHELGVGQWLPPGFDGWFAHCVTRDVSQRFRDASEAFNALSPVLLGPGRSSAPPLPYAGTQPLSQPPQPMPAFAPSHTPSIPQPPHTAVMTQGVAGLVDPRIPRPPVMMTEPVLSVSPSQPLPQPDRGPPKALIGAGAGLLVVLLGGLGVKLMGSNHSDSNSSTSSGTVVTPPAPVVPQTPPTPTCPSGMVLIPEGTFQMGSPEGVGSTDEHPQHPEHIAAFCMDRTEVTMNAYQAWSPAGTTIDYPGISATDRRSGSRYCNANFTDRGTHPVNCVDWNQSVAFCTSRGARLPSEAEWEYAARGTDGRSYPWGNDAPASQLCWSGGTPRQSTCVVGSFPSGASPLGLQDMAGNVWEWTSTNYAATYGGTPDASLRVFRGGSWGVYDAAWVRAASRHWSTLTLRGDFLGFRCARGVL